MPAFRISLEATTWPEQSGGEDVADLPGTKKGAELPLGFVRVILKMTMVVRLAAAARRSTIVGDVPRDRTGIFTRSGTEAQKHLPGRDFFTRPGLPPARGEGGEEGRA
jgi:hypothetical protein